MWYDYSNRVVQATPSSGGGEYYGYAPDNKRIYSNTNGREELTLYGAKGEKLGVYTLQPWGNPGQYQFYPQTVNVWFGGKLLWEGSPNLTSNGAVYQDRLGTNRTSGARFRPYGDEITATSNDRVKFATYTRDSFF